MARWKLREAHYLNVPGTVWEFSETDRTTGKQRRTQFPVPTLLNPDDPSDWNYKTVGMNGQIVDGELIVCHVGKGDPRDVEFVGEPTPSMEPLDDEARAISDSLAKKWQHPIDSLSPNFNEALIESFQKQMEKSAQEQQSRGGEVKIEGISELLSAITTMMKQNQEMMAFLVQGQQLGLKPQVDTADPLEDVEPTDAELAEHGIIAKRRA